MTDYISNGEDINFLNLSIDDSDKEFHTIIGHIEDILLDETFLKKHKDFLEKYWHEFSDAEENKLCYTDIFKEYSDTIEKHIEEELVKQIPQFNMSMFELELEKRQDELEGEIFEILETFSDFLSFKGMFLDYKSMKEGNLLDYSQDLYVSKYVVNKETQ